MRLLIGILLLALAFPAAGYARSADAVTVRNAAGPNADGFGLDSTRFPHVSFAGSEPRTLASLLEGMPPLGSGLAKAMLVAMLTMPVYPDGISAVPPGWFLLRLDTLIRHAAYEDALRLVSGLPEALLDDPISRRYVDLALTFGDTDAACKIVAARLADNATIIDAYWSLRRAFCGRLAGEADQTDLVLGVFSEQYPKQHALAFSLLSGWGNKTPFLPPLLPADAESAPLLVAALKHAEASETAARIGADFISADRADTAAPVLAVALSELSVFPVPLRIALLEHAVRAGAGRPEMLRSLYEQVKPGDALPPDRKAAALLIADINATQSGGNKVSTVANALQAFKRSFSPAVARVLLSKELDAFSAAPGDYPLTPELAVDLAAYNLDRGNAAAMREITDYLESHAVGNEAFGIALAVVREASALDGQMRGEAVPYPILPEFTDGESPPVLWTLQRLVTVKRSLGHELPAGTAALSSTAPLAASASPDSALLVALQNAENHALAGELILRSVQLLNGGRLAYASDAVLARLLVAIRKSGQEAFALALARDAVLNPPVESLALGAAAATP